VGDCADGTSFATTRGSWEICHEISCYTSNLEDGKRRRDKYSAKYRVGSRVVSLDKSAASRLGGRARGYCTAEGNLPKATKVRGGEGEGNGLDRDTFNRKGLFWEEGALK